jgi:hypothetical protein
VERCTPVEYTYFPNSFFAILHISLALMYIYCINSVTLQVGYLAAHSQT